jgi:uncharacterized protein YecT (DUF1311 family)
MFRPFLLAPLLLASAPALAQSFDCKKAAAPVERLICADSALQKLDSDLAEELRAALDRSLAEREKLLAEERQWVAERDKKCPVPKGELVPAAREATAQCLRGAYTARVAAVEALIAQEKAARAPEKALCQTFADRYRAALEALPKDKRAKEADPYGLLTKSPKSGVVEGPTPDEIAEPSPAALEKWARSQKPPFKLSPKVVAATHELNPGNLTLSRAPGLPFYSAGSIGGTAQCVTETYFEVRDGVAEHAGDLPWGDDGAGCGVSRTFGTVDGQVVAFETNGYAYQPLLAATVRIAKWERGFFDRPCEADFDYAPVFSLSGDDEMPEDQVKCDGVACLALRGEAIALVEAIQKSPQAARKAALGKLTEPQRAQFATLEKLAPAPDLGDPLQQDAEDDPTHLLDTNPLRIPFAYKGEVYLVGVGHQTMGWRTYPNWSVTSMRREKDGVRPAGWVGVTMDPGRLSKATVK